MAQSTEQQKIQLFEQTPIPKAVMTLAIPTVLSSLNIDEAVGMWKFLRDHNIEPYFECITPQGRLLEHRTLLPEPEKRLFWTEKGY